MIIFFIFYLIVAFTIAIILGIRHTPRQKLTEKQKEEIRKYGLRHFTNCENIPYILQDGLIPYPKKAMLLWERKMVWVWINRPDTFEADKKKTQSKGDRRSYDSVIIIEDLSEEQLNHLLYRPSDGAIVHIGSLKTEHISYKKIEPLK